MASSGESAPLIRSRRPRDARTRSSYQANAPLAEAAIIKDLEEEPNDESGNPINNDNSTDESDSDDSTTNPGATGTSPSVSMVESYRRPGFTSAGLRATAVTGRESSTRYPTKRERHEARQEERNLLRDNDIITSKRSKEGGRSESVGSQLEGNHAESLSSTSLLGNNEDPYRDQDSPVDLDKAWEEAVMAGKIRTTWQRESKVLTRYSAPLILTFLLQYSLTAASIFAVGHLGTIELGAVSLASMTANITGYAIYQGLATSLDTLCAQAYGSGRKKLVGLQMQRMVCSLVKTYCSDLIGIFFSRSTSYFASQYRLE